MENGCMKTIESYIVAKKKNNELLRRKMEKSKLFKQETVKLIRKKIAVNTKLISTKHVIYCLIITN